MGIIMASKLQSLVEIFNNTFFRIPDYQRGYAWTRDELEAFWEDLTNLSPSKFHYTGLLTVEPIDKTRVEQSEKWKDDLWMFNKGLKAYYIIDGQQRLTTIIILLKSVIDKFGDSSGINFEPKNSWISRFLYQQYGNYKSYVFGYEKDNPSDEFFKTKILGQISLSSAHVPEQTLYTMNLQYAKIFFEGKIEKLDKNGLEVLFKKIVNSLKFNFYEIDSDLDVFVTFEVMNNRGKNLSKLELLKNRLIYLTTLLQEKDTDKDRLRKDINDAWKTVYEYLGKNKDNPLDDDDFLKNHWIMYFKYDRKEAEAFSEFLLKNHFIVKNLVNDSVEKIDFTKIKEYVESISKSVINWFYISNPKYSNFNEDIKMYLEKLNHVGFGAFAPIIMCAMGKGVTEGKLLKLLEISERFAFLIFKLSKRPANTRNSYFYKLANDFYKNDLSIDDVIKSIEVEIDGDKKYYGWFDVDDFKKHISDLYKKGEGFYSWNGVKYFLYEYELSLKEAARGDEKVKWDDINQESIEHIYPHVADKKSCWTDKFSMLSENNSILLHSLGNLLLLSQSKNSEWQNECFEFKKKHKDKKGNLIGYFNGSYSEIEVASLNEWTPKDILERSLKMLDFMEHRWNIKIGDTKTKIELLLLTFVARGD